MKALLRILLFLLPATNVIAQEIDRVSQLINVETRFNELVEKKGLKRAFLSVSDNSTIAFRPGPKSAKSFYKSQPDSIGVLQLSPFYAKIAKSDDWGFTAGTYEFLSSDLSGKKFYGTYVSVWKKNQRGTWRLALDAGVSHKKPSKTITPNFVNPEDHKFIHQRSENRLKQREDIVLSSDQLLATITRADNRIAQNEFLTDDSWLIFPGNEPVIGKNAIMDFWKKNSLKAISVPQQVDRAYSGEIAYTYGTATILAKRYNYLRIWEVQPGYKWNVALELYTVAE